LDAALRQWVRDKSKEITFNTNASTATMSSPEAQEENIRQMLQMLQIPGIDGKKGLSLYGFDFDTYLHVLRSYTTNMPAIIESLHHVSKENLAIYAINVHGLKGSSGNIGATNVMERAAHMEEAAKAGYMSEVLKENEDFLEEAHALEDAVKIWLAKHDEENQKPHLQTPDMALLNKLRKCCEQFDMNGVDDVMDELERFFYDNDNDLIGWLREKVDLSDLDSVEVRIKELS
jgi:HPt (histidine-containing phosphotransfer) domain-containing protein